MHLHESVSTVDKKNKVTLSVVGFPLSDEIVHFPYYILLLRKGPIGQVQYSYFSILIVLEGRRWLPATDPRVQYQVN
jgi:hypothetical protein